MDKVINPPKTKEQKIAFLKEQLADREKNAAEYRDKLQARIDLIAARGSTQDRKDDTRRKILLGAMLKDRIQKRKIAQAKTDEWMSQFLERDEDRRLFGLAPIDKTVSNEIDNDNLHLSEITVNETKSELPDSFYNYN